MDEIVDNYRLMFGKTDGEAFLADDMKVFLGYHVHETDYRYIWDNYFTDEAKKDFIKYIAQD